MEAAAQVIFGQVTRLDMEERERVETSGHTPLQVLSTDEDCVNTSQPTSPSRPTPTTDSDSGCSCCPSGDSDSKLTQRRSLQAESTRPLREKSGSVQTGTGGKVLQERVLWVILLLACTALICSLIPLKGSKGLVAGLSAASDRLIASLTPKGPILWQFQWRVNGKPDPRPLWDTSMLGTATDWPHGSATGFATAMGNGSIQTVAVVGNGPLTDAQRQEIAEADRIVRFNAMNNRRMDERVDVWVVRSNNIPPYLFWGFQQLQDVEIEGVIHQAKAVLFLGGSKSQDNSTEMAKAVEKVLFWFPDMQPSQIQQVKITSYWDVYNKVLAGNSSVTVETANTMPSSGLLGLMAVLAAVGSKVRVDLYGFNWSLKSYERHKMSAEELIIQAVRQKYPNIQVHPTACKAALYSCDALCDTNQFRLAVDEANCHKQVEKAKQGMKARFVDLHTVHNLDWYPELRAELKAPNHLKGKERKAWLKQAAIGAFLEGENDSPAPKVAESPGIKETAAAPNGSQAAASPQPGQERLAPSAKAHGILRHPSRKTLKKSP